MLGKIPLWCCLIVALPALGTSPIHELLFLSDKIPLWSFLMVTLPTRLLHPFMNLCVGQVVPLNLPYGNILQGYFTPSWNALLCWVSCHLRLPYGHIACKGTSPLHELLLCGRLRLLLDLTLWLHSVHFNPLFLCTSSWCCFIFSFVSICFSQMLHLCFKNLSSVFR